MKSISLYLLVIATSTVSLGAEAPVRAELGKETAWVGEAVSLVITLYSPGPFDGTAAFDLPNLPKTTFVKTGNPVVGSDKIDGKSFTTQRHQFAIYTQQSGQITIPPLQIRYAGKPTFLADPEPMEATTPELKFRSQRPPGTDQLGIVVSASDMQVEQTWAPDSATDLTGGDVIQRTILRSAEGTTAMMFPAISATAPKEVEVYSTEPQLRDFTERGESRAQRTDIIKYQFQKAGTFVLPAIEFVCWDPDQQQLIRSSVAELTVDVAAAETTVATAPDSTTEDSRNWFPILLAIAGLGIMAWLLRDPVSRVVSAIRAHYNRPEARAVRQLRTACTANDASKAYAAISNWYHAISQESGVPLETIMENVAGQSLYGPWQDLSRDLFSPTTEAQSWNGQQLWKSFCQTRKSLKHNPIQKAASSLPPLNPVA